MNARIVMEIWIGVYLYSDGYLERIECLVGDGLLDRSECLDSD